MGPGDVKAKLADLFAAHDRRVAAAHARLMADVAELIEGVADGSACVFPTRAQRDQVQAVIGLDAPVRRVLEAASDVLEIPLKHLTGPSRTQPLTRARQIAMAVAAERTPASTTVIGRVFGRDHTTVTHAVGVIQAGMTPDLRQTMDLIAAKAGLMGLEAAE